MDVLRNIRSSTPHSCSTDGMRRTTFNAFANGVSWQLPFQQRSHFDICGNSCAYLLGIRLNATVDPQRSILKPKFVTEDMPVPVVLARGKKSNDTADESRKGSRNVRQAVSEMVYFITREIHTGFIIDACKIPVKICSWSMMYDIKKFKKKKIIRCRLKIKIRCTKNTEVA